MSLSLVDIREMSDIDLDVIFEIEAMWEKEQVSFLFEPITREEFCINMKKFKEYFLVALINKKIIGYINGTIRNKDNERVIKKGKKYLQIENLYVKAEYRNKNVGSALIQRIVANAHEKGITNYIVATDTKDMEKILRFYKKHGFKPYYVQMYKTEE